jgi:hypothetical protein
METNQIPFDLVRQAAEIGENLLHRYEYQGCEYFNYYEVEFDFKHSTIFFRTIHTHEMVAAHPFEL